MAARKRTQAQRELDLAETARLLRRGWSKTQVARKIGVSRVQVLYDWKQLLGEALADRELDTEAARTGKLEEYREVKAEAWAGWERSKTDKERRVGETVTTDAGPAPKKGKKAKAGASRTKTVRQVEGRLPEHDYLKVILSCLDAERELEGLNPPRKIAPTTPDGEEPYQDLSDARLQSIIQAESEGSGSPRAAKAKGGAGGSA